MAQGSPSTLFQVTLFMLKLLKDLGFSLCCLKQRTCVRATSEQNVYDKNKDFGPKCDSKNLRQKKLGIWPFDIRELYEGHGSVFFGMGSKICSTNFIGLVVLWFRMAGRRGSEFSWCVSLWDRGEILQQTNCYVVVSTTSLCST